MNGRTLLNGSLTAFGTKQLTMGTGVLFVDYIALDRQVADLKIDTDGMVRSLKISIEPNDPLPAALVIERMSGGEIVLLHEIPSAVSLHGDPAIFDIIDVKAPHFTWESLREKTLYFQEKKPPNP